MTLDSQYGLEWIWWLSGEQTLAIPAGRYTLVAVLDTSQAKEAAAWKGTAESASTKLDFQAPGQVSAEQEGQKEIQSARVEALAEDYTGAISRLERLVRGQPKNIEALSLLAALLADQGKLEEALMAYDRAIEASCEAGAVWEGNPITLLRERRAVRGRLEKSMTGP